MLTIIMNTEVKNYADWKPVFDGDEADRTAAGFKLTGLYHALDNPNKVTLIFEVPSVEAMNEFMARPELKERMERGGVIGQPHVNVLTKI
jgi:hypothetical protein